MNGYSINVTKQEILKYVEKNFGYDNFFSIGKIKEKNIKKMCFRYLSIRHNQPNIISDCFEIIKVGSGKKFRLKEVK